MEQKEALISEQTANGKPAASDPRSEELAAIIQEIRDRVRARYPGASAAPFAVALPDLTPLLHARDAAQAKVASIGTVNPRPGGLANRVVQLVKRTVSRAMRWHVREQVVFNRAVLRSLDANLDALNDFNRTFVALASQIAAQMEQVVAKMEDIRTHTFAEIDAVKAHLDRAMQSAAGLKDEAAELKDIRKHWAEWRVEWERKLSINEVQFLRSVADLQAGFQHRVTLLEAAYRDVMGIQNKEFTATLDKGMVEVQQRLWDDLRKVRAEYERLIHTELRMIRQRLSVMPVPAEPGPAVPAPLPAVPALDYGRFAEKFRGTEEYVRENQRVYLPYFAGCKNVLDIGCGRGEFLDLMKESGVAARGIDLGEESVASCRAKGHPAEVADLFVHLASLEEGSLDGIFCAQVVEHLPPERLAEMVRLCARALQMGGILAIETPNPECLAIFASHFYLDPTHTRPVPPSLLAFYYEESGIGHIEIRRLAPAVESMPSLTELPENFRDAFFGGLDYGIIGRRL